MNSTGLGQWTSELHRCQDGSRAITLLASAGSRRRGPQTLPLCKHLFLCEERYQTRLSQRVIIWRPSVGYKISLRNRGLYCQALSSDKATPHVTSSAHEIWLVVAINDHTPPMASFTRERMMSADSNDCSSSRVLSKTFDDLVSCRAQLLFSRP